MTKDAMRRRTTLASSRGAVVGVAGNSSYFGYQVTGEYLKKLDGAKGRAVFEEMYRSDPQVRATYEAITLPIRTCEYDVEPGRNGAPDAEGNSQPDDLDLEIAEKVGRRLFHGMTMTWDDTVRHALLMLRSGFSILEKIWERDDEGLVMPKKLDPRLASSVVRWDFDKAAGRLVGPVQVDVDGKEYHLPIEKLLVFTTDREGDNWEGTSIYRFAYKPWYIKDQLEKVNAIKHDRHGVGIPRAKVPAGLQRGMPQWDDTVDALERLYANERSYIIDPEGYETDILGAGDKAGTDALPSIKYYDDAIARASLAMFLNLGTTDTGSRALGASFVEVFQLAVQAYADYIAEVFNRFLIREWCGYNWDVGDFPRLCAGRIKPIDSTVLAALATARVIVPDLELENKVRRTLYLPERTEARPAPVVSPTPGETAPAPEMAPTQETPEEPVAEELADVRRRLAEAAPTDQEKLVDWAGMGMRLAVSAADLAGQLKVMRDAQAADLVMQALGGRKVQDMRVVLKKDMFDLLAAAYKKERKTGLEDVRSEVQRQRPDLKMADPRRKAKVKPAEFDALSLDQISLDVEKQADAIRSAVASWTIDLRKSGLQGDQLKIALEARYQDMSTASLDLMAGGAVDKGWGSGRLTGFEEVADEIEYCYRSAILDTVACEVCRAKDGRHHELGDPEFMAPDPECLGTDRRCRCMTISVMKAEGASALAEIRDSVLELAKKQVVKVDVNLTVAGQKRVTMKHVDGSETVALVERVAGVRKKVVRMRHADGSETVAEVEGDDA